MFSRLFRLSRPAQPAQAVVEFALVLPVLVLLLAGIVDLANGYSIYLAVSNAAREGAAYAAYPTDGATGQNNIETKACTYVQQALPSSIVVSCSSGSPNFTYPAVAGCAGGSRKLSCPVRVTLTYTFNTYFAGAIGFDNVTVNPYVDMMVLI